MQQLALPVRHEWIVREQSYGKIAIEPFEPGLALTVGNAYRRVLLSSIPGAAPTWVKIEGVLHEFSHMQGVNEDTLDIIMNLRKLVFAGLQRAHAPSRDGEEQESERASDDARVVELAGNLEEAAVGRDLDDARPAPDSGSRRENPPGLKP